MTGKVKGFEEEKQREENSNGFKRINVSKIQQTNATINSLGFFFVLGA